MSHILEEYAKCLGTTGGKPIIDTHFFPITETRYITVETAPEGFSSLNYPYWHNVVNLIKDYDSDISFIDISHGGEKVNPAFDKSINGNCSYRQLAYIISKSSAHISIDSYTSHLASLYNIPSVTLHAHVPQYVSSPVWHEDESMNHSISGHKDGIKPCYSKDDPEDLISTINPESIAVSILNKLGIDHDLDSYQTVNIGKYYKDKILEVVPDFPASDFVQSKLINLRCDYNFDIGLIKEWLNFKLNLMIDRPIPIEILLQKRSNIAGLTIFIKDDSITENYIDQLKQARFSFGLVCPDKNIISDIRLKFFDSDVEEYKINEKKNLDFHEDICDNSFYHSNKTLISKGEEYKSKAHWLHADKFEDDSKIIDCPEFWEEIEHFNIYNHAKKEN